jgi:hypothetical protein
VQSSSVVIVGLARNCQRTLRADVARLSWAAGAFRRRQVLVVESDSTDGTRDILAKMAKQTSDFRSLSLGNLQQQCPLRTDRIAYCRNAYLAELRTSPTYSGVDYVIVADLDGVNSRLTPAALATCWSDHVGSWDVCTANQSGPYYDVWALRHPAWCPGDCWAAFQELEPIFGTKAALQLAVWSKMVHIPRTAAPIQVRSAFGGLAVYRAAALLEDVKYVGLTDAGAEVCEHVALHEQLVRRGYRIVINPGLVSAGVTSHIPTFWFRLRAAVLRLRDDVCGVTNSQVHLRR